MQKPLNTSQFSTMHSSSSEEDENALGKAGYVGVESYVDLQSNLNLEPYKWFSSGGGEDAGLMRKKKKVKLEREYPPPIPWLARTDHCAFSQMQWEMKRYYTSDGRLIIKEEKAKRFEYFEVHRTDGRLMLNLVPLNDDGSESNSDDDDGDVSETDDYDEGKVDGTAEENESPLVNGGGAPAIGGGGSGGIKCSSLCTFGIAVPASRPVHT